MCPRLSPFFAPIFPCRHRREQPQVMDYIKVKAQVASLQERVVELQRKIEVASMVAGG